MKTARALLGASALLLAGSTSASASPAGEVKVVVLPVATEGEVGDVARQRIESAVEDALDAAGVSSIDADAQQPCDDATCLQSAAEEAGASHALQLRVSATGRDYTTEVSVSDTGGTVSKSAAECAICGFDEVADVVRDETATLATKILAQGLPARLRIASEPAGAVVLIDGEPAGRAPLEVEIAPGEHQIRVEKDGYVVAEDTVTSAEGVEESLNMRLRKLPGQRDAKMVRGGWAAVGAGAGLLVASAVLWGVHHQPVRSLCVDDEDIDVNGICRWRYESVPYAVPMTVLGVAGVVTGAVLVGLGKRGRKERRTDVAISPSGVSIAGRF